MKNIQAVTAVIGKPKATKIHTNITLDNCKDSAQFQVFFYHTEGEGDLASDVHFHTAYVECTGDDYKNWNGNNDFPSVYAAGKLGLTII